MSTDKAMVTEAMVEAGAMALAGDEWKGIHDRPRFLRDARECISAALAHPPAKREAGETAPPESHLSRFTPPRCRCEYPMIKYGGKTVACDHCGLPPGHSPVRQPQTHVDGERKFCDFPECGCSSGAAERCSHPPVSRAMVSDTPSAALEASHE